jgi:hypothetical protein
MTSTPSAEIRYNTLVNLPVVIPHILQSCPELDAEGVLELIREKTGLSSLHPEVVQDIRALVLRELLRRRSYT